MTDFVRSRVLSRRRLLEMSGLGFGSLALSCLLAEETPAAGPPRLNDVVPRKGHFQPRAKSVIMLMQPGGPSQMDLFDPKPALFSLAGKVYHEKVEMFQPGSETNMLLAPAFDFERHGECGMDMSVALPHIAGLADELCMIRSMHTGHNNHTEALVMLTSGKIFPGRPTLGAWISYGLGSENQNLPAFVVLRDPKGYPGTGATLWQNGWLPAVFRGTEIRSEGEPVPDLRPPDSVPSGSQVDDLQLLARLNKLHRRNYPDESVLDARIRNYELAARMQLAAAGVFDLSRESALTHKAYGLENPVTQSYGRRCLMARRLVESGVRFVQVFPAPGNPWDSHKDSRKEIGDIASKTDLPTAALIKDLKQRGLLDETIVMWGGEFGRLPVSQNGTGRDHNRNAFTMLLAGGGFRRGYVHGATDPVGYRAVENRVGVNDMFATLLHQLGLDHTRLTYPHHGRNETLTDSTLTDAQIVADLLHSPPAI